MIESAAIRLKKGKIISGRTHAICHSVLQSVVTRISAEDGFVTTDGYFVNREEAYKIAVKCGQIQEKPSGFPKKLYSEDLNYPEEMAKVYRGEMKGFASIPIREHFELNLHQAKFVHSLN